MSERNKLTASPIKGEDALLINGFKITLVVSEASDGVLDVVYTVRRKELNLGTYETLQEAVKWCED